MPTLDGTLLRIQNKGNVSTWFTFCEGCECGNFGTPFGIISEQGSLVLTITDFGKGGRLLRVRPNKQIQTIAELSPMTPQGRLFDVIEVSSRSNYICSDKPD